MVVPLVSLVPLSLVFGARRSAGMDRMPVLCGPRTVRCASVCIEVHLGMGCLWAWHRADSGWLSLYLFARTHVCVSVCVCVCV